MSRNALRTASIAIAGLLASTIVTMPAAAQERVEVGNAASALWEIPGIYDPGYCHGVKTLACNVYFDSFRLVFLRIFRRYCVLVC